MTGAIPLAQDLHGFGWVDEPSLSHAHGCLDLRLYDWQPVAGGLIYQDAAQLRRRCTEESWWRLLIPQYAQPVGNQWVWWHIDLR
jgi:hypothetical protein